MTRTVNTADTYPIYLRCVEYARARANDQNESHLTYGERFNAALIAIAYSLGKESK